MPNSKDPAELVEEEVAFWRRFIDWWEQKEGRPATQRMRDMLAYAEAKRDLVGSKVTDEPEDGVGLAKIH